MSRRDADGGHKSDTTGGGVDDSGGHHRRDGREGAPDRGREVYAVSPAVAGDGAGASAGAGGDRSGREGAAAQPDDPRSLATRPTLRIATLCAFYFAQGVPWGFVAITLVAWLAKAGTSTAAIGEVMALATLPWSFKWLWGPIIDAVHLPGGRRRPWIIIAQAMMALTMAALLVYPGLLLTTTALGVTIFVHNCFNALQDVAVDALAVDMLDEGERGRANGLMYGSKYLGGAVGGAGLGWVIATFDMTAALAVQAATLSTILVLPIWLREGRAAEAAKAPAQADSDRHPAAIALRRATRLLLDLRRAFSLRSPLLGAAFAACAYLASGVLSTVGTVLFTREIGWTAAHYSAVQGGLCLAFGLGGAVGGGFIADALGARRTVAAATIALGLVWIGFALGEAAWSSDAFVTTVLVVESALSAVMSVGLFALFMQLAWPRVAATQFTAYMALLNLSTTLGHAAAGSLDAWLDYGGLYLLAGAVQIGIAVLLVRIDARQTRRELGPT